MTENKRIVLNTIATYGRSMFGVLCGIFSARWVLEALGHVDFGLYGLIGSMALFVGFLNIQFSSAIARYYAYTIGKAKASINSAETIEECREWFSIAVLIHFVLPISLIAIGYPLGVKAINYGWVTVPLDRIDACLWLWRFVCVSCFVSMVNVPFQAMYTAKQYIAELTIYSFLQTVLRTGFVYYMVCHPGDWLIGYGFGMMFVTVIPAFLICIRACFVFPECRLRLHAFRQMWRVRQLGSYAVWQGVGGLGYLASHEGMSVLINNMFGTRFTGSFSIAQTVAGEAASLTGALQGAFAPAITSSYGEGNQARMLTLAFNACRYGTLLTMMFAIPMSLEINEILRLWLKNPPPNAAEMCVCVLAFITIEKLSTGHLTAVNASGKVARFQSYRGLLRMSVIPLALVAYYLHLGLTATMLALPLSAVIVVLCDVWMARQRVGMSSLEWVKSVLLPLCYVGGATLFVGGAVILVMSQSFLRLICTTVISLSVLALVAWCVVLNQEERTQFSARLKKYVLLKRMY